MIQKSIELQENYGDDRQAPRPGMEIRVHCEKDSMSPPFKDRLVSFIVLYEEMQQCGIVSEDGHGFAQLHRAEQKES